MAKDLAWRLRTLGYVVLEEFRVPTATSFIKPDLIAVRHEAAIVMYMSIVEDNRSTVAWDKNILQYEGERPSAAIYSSLTTCGFRQPVIQSYRGMYFSTSAKALSCLDLPSYNGVT